MPSLEDMTPEQQDQALKLFNFVQANPDVAKQIRKEAKKRNPNMQAPDLELEERLEAQEKAFNERLAKQDDERLAQIQQSRREEAHARIRAAGLDPESVEKIMVDESIGNYDTAIKYAQHQRQLAPATQESASPLTMPSNKDLYANKERWARTTAFEAINELKAKRLG